MESLKHHIARLPRELQDCILDIVLITPNEAYIDRSYKPPVQLQINKALRRGNMERFYSSTTFTISDSDLALSWLQSLGAEIRSYMRTLRLDSASFKSPNAGVTAIGRLYSKGLVAGSVMKPLVDSWLRIVEYRLPPLQCNMTAPPM